MTPAPLTANAQVEINDSCNNCCCFPFRRNQNLPRPKRQTPFIVPKAETPTDQKVQEVVKENLKK